MMKLQKIHIQIRHKKPRAIELYGHGTPFKHKTEKLKVRYIRKKKHKGDFE